jgi:hypothetical protein
MSCQMPAVMTALARPLGVQTFPVGVVVAHFNENLGCLEHLASTE